VRRFSWPAFCSITWKHENTGFFHESVNKKKLAQTPLN
jgi:hypothetical protein